MGVNCGFGSRSEKERQLDQSAKCELPNFSLLSNGGVVVVHCTLVGTVSTLVSRRGHLSRHRCGRVLLCDLSNPNGPFNRLFGSRPSQESRSCSGNHRDLRFSRSSWVVLAEPAAMKVKTGQMLLFRNPLQPQFGVTISRKRSASMDT